MICTSYEAEDWLLEDLVWPTSCINARVIRDLNQAQFDALCSLIYNVGVHEFSKSTALADLNKGDLDGFYDQAFSRERGWTHQDGLIIEGLVRRRAAEQRLFAEGIYS